MYKPNNRNSKPCPLSTSKPTTATTPTSINPTQATPIAKVQTT